MPAFIDRATEYIIVEEQPPATSSRNPGEGIMHQPEYSEEEPEFPGPLMRSEMQKEDLIRVIQWNVQLCLQQIHQPKQAEDYLFWQIMELFCRQNGKVMMCEVAPLLFQGYSMLRKKVADWKCAQKWRMWCIPLAQLLCSSAPDDEHREAVIKMGDDLASRRLTYAAHICYVVAKVELGSHSQFKLIGCDSVPFGLTVFNEAIVRTETYEYVLSLISGLAQPNFQIFKLCYASRLAIFEQEQCDSSDGTIKYCETIARAVIASPNKFKRSFIKHLILLSSKQQEEETEEPEWLLELLQLHKTKLANAHPNDDPEQYMKSTSHDIDSEIQDSEYRLMTGETPALQSPYLGQYNDITAFDSRYTMGKLLGEGTFGCVYEGIRNKDWKQVAIKVVDKEGMDETMTIPGETQELPVEVALMKIVSKPPHCSNVVELLEWFDLPHKYVLVLERPSPCMDLRDFIESQNGHLSEAQARGIMVQVVQAAHHCCNHGVLHRDIKAENLLINTNTLHVKLIDFGYGVLLKDTAYDEFSGTDVFAPPEWLMFEEYMGISGTIWGLGIFLYNLLSGLYPIASEEDFDYAYLVLSPDVSQECLELMMWCLDLNPEVRPTFNDLFRHEWFTEAV